MTRKRRIIGDSSPMVYVLISVAGSYLVLAICAMVMAGVCSLTADPSALTGAASFAALLLCAGVSGFLISRLRGEGGFLCAMLAAALFVVVRIVISIFLVGTDISDLLDYACYLGIGAIFALIGQRKTRRKRR